MVFIIILLVLMFEVSHQPRVGRGAGSQYTLFSEDGKPKIEFLSGKGGDGVSFSEKTLPERLLCERMGA